VGGDNTLNARIRARSIAAAAVFLFILLTAGPHLSPGNRGPSGVAPRLVEPVRNGPPFLHRRRPEAWRGAFRAGIPPVIRSPHKTRHVDPVYPEGARQERIEGVVLVEMLVNEGGTVEDARVMRSIALLDAAALEAVRQWRFTPSLLDDRPVKVILTASVRFDIRE
jgi:protein TonB